MDAVTAHTSSTSASCIVPITMKKIDNKKLVPNDTNIQDHVKTRTFL
jgi:hypothetical protein